MTSFFIILGIFLWVVLAFWPAYLAKRKGHSFILILLLGLVTSWLISLIVVLFMSNRNLTPQQKADDEAAEAAIERETNIQ